MGGVSVPKSKVQVESSKLRSLLNNLNTEIWLKFDYK
jgi:hypothetical protein